VIASEVRPACGFSDLLPGWISRYLGAVAIFKQSGSDLGSPRLRSRLATRSTSYLRLLWTTPVFIGLVAAGIYAIGHMLGEHTSWPSALWLACCAGAASAALDARRIRKRREAEGVAPKILEDLPDIAAGDLSLPFYERSNHLSTRMARRVTHTDGLPAPSSISNHTRPGRLQSSSHVPSSWRLERT
jgi:hypothetical protein